MKKRVLSLLVDNTAGVLSRISQVFSAEEDIILTV